MRVLFVFARENAVLLYCLIKRLRELDKIIANNDYADSLTSGYIEEREDIIKMLDRFK